MIWLRHELWEYNDGLGYRLADRTGTDETGAGHREGTLRQVFYAPSPAAAKAQYWALRQLGPIIPSRFESDEPFTLAQLQAQLAQFPDDATLHGQPALHPDEAAPEAAPAVEPAVVAVIAGPDPEAEDETPQSLEPYPVIAHSEPALVDPAITDDPAQPEAPLEPVAQTAAQEAAEEAIDEAEPVSNVVPIRIAAANDALAAPDVANVEPRSREMAAMERQPAAASGALALALAELGPAAASSGALALALAELEPTPHAMPDDGHPAPGHSPLSLVASYSASTHEEPPVSDPLVAGTTVSHEPAPAPDAADPVAATHVAEPLVPEPVTAGAEVAEPLVPEPVAVEKALEPDPLGPITAVATAASKGKRRKSGFLTGLVRVLMLLIILGAVILGVGLATGTFDGPTLLAQAQALPEQARALPDQVRNLSIVRTLLPG